ncbi:hypothetical protein JCM11641_000205 [Rhodosporidiobolus odoratus]
MASLSDTSQQSPPPSRSSIAAQEEQVDPTSHAHFANNASYTGNGDAGAPDQLEDDDFGAFVYTGRDAEPSSDPFTQDYHEGVGDYHTQLESLLESTRNSDTASVRDEHELLAEAESTGRRTSTRVSAANGRNDEDNTPTPSSPAASRVTSASNDELPGFARPSPTKRARSSLGSVPSPYPQRPSFHPAISRLRSIPTQSSPSSPAAHNRVISSSTYNTALEYPAGAPPPRRPPFGLSASPSSSALDNISRRSSTSNLFDLPSMPELPSTASNASSVGFSEAEAAPSRSVKWSSLKRISTRVFPSTGNVPQTEQMAKSAMGQPTVMAVSGLVAIGTSRGWTMVFDFGQNLRCVCGTEGIAKDSGAVTALAVSQDHTFLASGHANGAIHLYSLLKPAQPARSVPPVALPQVLAGRKEGHLEGSKILHLGFVGARHTAIVSSDDQGLAFYHSLGKVLMLASTDIIRMLGRYPDAPKTAISSSPVRPTLTSVATAPPSASLAASTPHSLPPSSPGTVSFPHPRASTTSTKKPTTILDMAPLPLGPSPHSPSDSLHLVALLTPTKLVVVALKPTPRTWWRVTFPPREGDRGGENGFVSQEEEDEKSRGYATTGVLGWWPSSRRMGDASEQADKRDEVGKGRKGQEEAGEDPMLAWAWGRRVGLVRVREDLPGKAMAGRAGGKAAPLLGVDFEEMQGWSCDQPVLGLRWYSEKVIVVLTASHFDIYDVATRNRIGRDAHDIRAIVAHSHYASAFDSSISAQETLSFSSSFSTYKRRLFLLLQQDVQAGAVLSWADCILSLMQPATILQAIERTTAYYQGLVDASTITLPEDPLERRDILEPKLREILNASLDFVFSEDRLRDGSHADGDTVQRLFEDLVGTCVRACLALDDVHWLFDDLFERYEQNGIESIFLERIEPFVLVGAVHSLPPSVSQRLIAIHAERGRFDAAQRIIWSVDPQNLDLNQALRLCQREKLYDALIYVYNRTMHDYVSPFIELLGLVRRIQRHRKQRPRWVGIEDGEEEHELEENGRQNGSGGTYAEEDVEALAPDAYRIFSYLRQALVGLSYPKREELSPAEADHAREALYTFLFSGQTRAWPEKGGRSVLTSDEDGGVEPTYPYLRLLLRFDTEALLDTLDLAFEDPYLDDDEEASSPRRGISRQRIVNLLLEAVDSPSSTGDFSPINRTFLHIFVARNIPKYPQFLHLPPSTLRTILVDLASDPDLSTLEDRQLAAEYLLSSFVPSDIDSLIPLFDETGFFRILRSVYRSEKRWSALASSYLEDPDVGTEIFGFLRETLSLATRASGSQKQVLAETIIDAVPALIQADEMGLQLTADLIDAHLPARHADAIERLAASPWRQFAYLRYLIEPFYSDSPPSPSYDTPRSPSTHIDPSLRSLYLSLLCAHNAQHVIRYLESSPGQLAQDDEVLRICRQAGAADAVVWAVDRRGDPEKALDEADDALEARTDILLQKLLGGVEPEEAGEDGEEDGGSLSRSNADALLEQVVAVSAAATKVCAHRSTGRRRPKDASPEDLWFRLLSSLVSTVQSIRTIAPAPPRASDLSSSHRRTSGASILIHDDAPQQLSPYASDLLSSLIPSALSSLVSSTTSHEVSFPRLMRRLIELNSRSPAASRSYCEFKSIVTSMLDTYAFEGDILSLSSKITEQDLFEHAEEHKRQRDRGWRPGDGNPLGECAECLQPVWGPQGAGSSPVMSRSASVSMVVEAMGMASRPRMRKRPSLKGKEVDWPEFNAPPPSAFGAPGLPPLDPPRGVVVGRDGRLWHQGCHLLLDSCKVPYAAAYSRLRSFEHMPEASTPVRRSLNPTPYTSPSTSTRRQSSSASDQTRLETAPGGDPTDVVKADQDEQQEASERPATSGWANFPKRIFAFLFAQWFIIGIGVAIGLAAAFPNVARSGGIIQAQWSIKYLAVAIIFLISGLTLPPRNLWLRAGNWKLHLVCHITSFLLFPTVVFAIINCVRAADPDYKRFNRWALIGMQVMGVLPTTVSSNVTMTFQAGGDQAATTVEVMLGNLVGTFLSPALLQMYLSSGTWSFGKPVASGGGGTGRLYEEVIKQLGYTVFIPLFVGEVIQYFFPKQTKWTRDTFRLGKVGTFCLLLIIWSTFSGAFYENAFKVLSGEAVAFIVCVNILLYIVFTLFLFAMCRLIPTPSCHVSQRKLVCGESGPMFSSDVTIAALFTGAAKGAALGAPIVSILYGGLEGEAKGIVSLPLVLFQGSQVVLGQVTVAILKKWNLRVKRGEAEASGAAVKEDGVV